MNHACKPFLTRVGRARVALWASGREHAAASTRVRGFTLIEVLVALAIVAVALAASVRAVGMLSFNDSLLRDKSLAALSAGNRLAELRLEKRFPEIGSLQVPCPQGRLMLACEQRVSGTPNPSFRQVSVRVTPEGRPLELLVEVDGLISALP